MYFNICKGQEFLFINLSSQSGNGRRKAPISLCSLRDNIPHHIVTNEFACSVDLPAEGLQAEILTNFYLAEGKKQGVGTQQSHTRFDILKKALEDHPSMTATEVRDALDSVSKDNFGEFESTEWSIVFDSSNLTATYYHRENYETAYAFRLSGR